MTSPWLATASTSSSNDEPDPWSDNRSQPRSRLGSLSVSSSHLSTRASSSRPVDRHPLRTPSPHLASAASPGLVRRTNGSSSPSGATRAPPAPSPGGIASEWRAISAGLAGLFGSSSDTSRYRWPEDPVSGIGASTSKDKACNTTGDDGEGNKGHQASTLDKLEGWFGLRDGGNREERLARSSQPSLRASSAAAQETQVRVLIHPVAPTDTLSSLALHYGADIQTLRRSNRLWPGDAVQMRSVMYIPVDSCKHRPPNAEIKVLSSDGGAIVPAEQQAAAGNAPNRQLAFVPRDEDEELSAAIDPSKPNAATALPVPAEDPASDFMPDTNKSYNDEGLPAGGVTAVKAASMSRASSMSRLGGGYPSSLAPSARPDRRLAAASVFEASPLSGSGPGLRRSPSKAGSAGGSTTASASAASSGFVPPKGPIHVSKVPAEKLKFFAPSEKKAQGDAKKAVLGVGPGHADFDPGESGIDDLLARRTDEASTLDRPMDDKPSSSTALPTAATRPRFPNSKLASEPASSAVSDNGDADVDAEWKPNVWKFGELRTRPARASESAAGGGSSALLFDAGLEADGLPSRASTGQSAPVAGGEPEAETSYAGWNDAPPPNAIVAKAYDGGAAYKKRQHQKHHRLLHDLAAGLPANTGAASKWARPIQFGDSLPPAASTSAAGAGAGSRTGLATPPISSGKGFGKLLNDTIRGRISVEGALEAALEEVRSKTALDLPHHEAAKQVRASPAATRPALTASTFSMNADAAADAGGGGADGTGARPAAAAHELDRLRTETEAGAARGGWAGGSRPTHTGSGVVQRARNRAKADGSKDD